jgi:WD40 repeat protein/tetratricopeptide (TPR) repeat protein
MSIIKGAFPYLAHYLSSHGLMSFQENSVEIDNFASQQTFPLDYANVASSLPPDIQRSHKKSVRWLLYQGYTPTLKNEKIEWNPPVHSVVGTLLHTLYGHTSYVSSLVVLPGGILGSGSNDKTIKLWNPSTGECLRTLEGHTSNISSLVMLPGGILASGSQDQTIKLWNPSTGECLRTLEGYSSVRSSLAVLPGGILARGDRTINLWNPSTGECLRTLEGHSSYVSSLAVLPGGILASGSQDRTIKLWNPLTGECLKTLEGHSNKVNSLAVLPGGILASGSQDQTIKLWSPSTGECLRTLEGHSREVSFLAVLPGGILASASCNIIKLWNPLTGECLRTLEGHSVGVTSLAALPGGILASGSTDLTIKLWKCSSPSSQPLNLDQIQSYCQQAIQHLKTKVLEEDASIDSNLICPLTQELFIDPVIIDEEGHTFERSAILEHFARKGDCPLCRAPIKPDDMKSPKLNRPIREYANKVREKSPIPTLAAQAKDEKTVNRYLGLVKDFTQEGNYKEALKHLTEALHASNKSEHYADLPSLYEKLKEPAKAALAYLYLLKYQLSEGNLEHAKATIQEALRLTGASRVVSLALKKILAALSHAEGDTTKALTLYLELAEECKDETRVYLEKALLCNPEGIEIYEKLAPFYDDARKVYLYLLGFINLFGSNQAEALSFYNKARSLAPDHPLVPVAYLSRLTKEQVSENLGIYRLLADLFAQQKDLKAALKYLKKAIRSEENYDFHRYVSALLQLQEQQEAEKVYLKWSMTKSCSPIDVIYEGIQALGETSPLLERLVTLYTEEQNPALKEIALRLGALYEKENKAAEAMRIYELTYSRFKDFESGLQLAEMLRRENRVVESFNLASALAQEAFFSNQEENAERGLQQLLKTKPSYQKLSSEQRQFLMLAGLMQRKAQNLESKVQEVDKKENLGIGSLTSLPPALPVKVEPFFDVTKVSLLRELIVHLNDAFPLAVLPGGILASGSRNGTIKLWNPSTRECLRTLQGHSNSVYSFAVLPGGILASRSHDHTIKLWNPLTGECLRTLQGDSEGGSSLAVLPGGILASGAAGNTIKLWNPSTGESLRTLQGHSNSVYSLVVLPGGILASGAADNTIKLWNPSTGECLWTLEGHSSSVYSLAVLPGGILASGSWDNTIKLWNPSTRECLRTLQGHSNSVYSLVVLPGGILASGSSDGTIKLWNPLTGECLRTLQGHSEDVSSLAVLPGGILASESSNGTIQLWGVPLETPKLSSSVVKASQGEQEDEGFGLFD